MFFPGWQWNEVEIRPREVIALAEQWFTAIAGERIGETVAVVESGWMPPFPEVGERPARDLGLNHIDRHHLDAGGLDQRVEPAGRRPPRGATR